MQVSEAMTRNVRVANIDETIEQAAQLMAGLDAGALPASRHESGESVRLLRTYPELRLV